MENGFVARFERKVLFRITRWVALALCTLLFLILVGGALMFAGTWSSGVDRPDPSELTATATSGTAGNEAAHRDASTDAGSVLNGLRMPAIMQEQFGSGTNRRILENWLSDIDRDERQTFLDALGTAADAAQAAGRPIHEGINDYQDRYQDYLRQLLIAEAEAKAERLYVLAVIGSALALIALFSLVLVLMAIERNTRNSAAQEA